MKEKRIVDMPKCSKDYIANQCEIKPWRFTTHDGKYLCQLEPLAACPKLLCNNEPCYMAHKIELKDGKVIFPCDQCIKPNKNEQEKTRQQFLKDMGL